MMQHCVDAWDAETKNAECNARSEDELSLLQHSIHLEQQQRQGSSVFFSSDSSASPPSSFSSTSSSSSTNASYYEYDHSASASQTGQWERKKDKSVAVHFSLFYGSGRDDSWKRFIQDALRKCHFCFDEVLITIDTKHGGYNYGEALTGGEPRYAGPPYLYGAQEFIYSSDGQKLLEEANAVLANMSAHLERHCPERKASTENAKEGLRAQVLVIDYSSNESTALLRKAFDLKWPPAVPGSPFWSNSEVAFSDVQELGIDHRRFARMFKNSFMYNYIINAVQSDVLFHMDGDWDYLEPRHVSSDSSVLPEQSLISQAIAALTTHSDLVMVAPYPCQGLCCEYGGCESLDSNLGVVWATKTNVLLKPKSQECGSRWLEHFGVQQNLSWNSDKVPYVSTQIYATDVKRWKSLWPLSYWTDHIELLLMGNLADKEKKFAYLNDGLADICKRFPPRPPDKEEEDDDDAMLLVKLMK